MASWFPVADADGIAPGTGRVVRVEDRFLAVFNDGGEYYVVDDSCPHQGASLGEGFLHQGAVVCPWHSWKFDVRTGVCPGVPHIAVETFPTRRVGGAIEVQLPDVPADPGTERSDR